MKYLLVVLLILLKIVHAQASDSKIIMAEKSCRGFETILAEWDDVWTEFTCLSGEWMVAVNNKILTVKLVQSGQSENYYSFVPTVPTSAKQRWILRTHQLRFSSGREAVIVRSL